MRTFKGNAEPRRGTKIALARALLYLRKGGNVANALALLALDAKRQRIGAANCGYDVDDSRQQRIATLQAKLRELDGASFVQSTGCAAELRRAVMYRPNEVSDETLSALRTKLIPGAASLERTNAENAEHENRRRVQAELRADVLASGISKQALYDIAGLSWGQIERFYAGGDFAAETHAKVAAVVNAYNTAGGDLKQTTLILAGTSVAPTSRDPKRGVRIDRTYKLRTKLAVSA